MSLILPFERTQSSPMMPLPCRWCSPMLPMLVRVSWLLLSFRFLWVFLPCCRNTVYRNSRTTDAWYGRTIQPVISAEFSDRHRSAQSSTARRWKAHWRLMSRDDAHWRWMNQRHSKSHKSWKGRPLMHYYIDNPPAERHFVIFDSALSRREKTKGDREKCSE